MTFAWALGLVVLVWCASLLVSALAVLIALEVADRIRRWVW